MKGKSLHSKSKRKAIPVSFERWIILIGHSGHGWVRQIMSGLNAFLSAHPGWFCSLIAEDRLDITLSDLKKSGKNVAGFLVASAVPEIHRLCAEWNVPVLNLGGGENLPYPSVTVDDRMVGRRAAEHLLTRGYREFAFVSSEGWYWYERARLAGFTEYLQAHGVKEVARGRATYNVTLAFDPQLKRWLLDLPKPVGILAATDELAAQVLMAGVQLGFSVPEDVAIIGVDNNEMVVEGMRPTITSVPQPATKIAWTAAQLLIDMIESGQAPPARTLIEPGEVICRESTEAVAADDELVRQAMQYIRDHLHEQIGVKRLLSHLGVSRKTLDQHFIDTLGRTPAGQIRQLQLERARSLLTTTNLPLTRIADLTGFSGVRQLNDAMHRELGLTPTAYRRRAHAHAVN